MVAFDQAQQLFQFLGLDLASPVDRCKEGHFPFAKNVLGWVDDVVIPRTGTTAKSTGVASNTPGHSLRRLNATSAGADIHVAGIGTILATAPTAAGAETFTSRSTGFSGNPLALVPYRPERAPEAWMYAADSAKMVKVRYDSSAGAVVHNIGIDPPPVPPDAYVDTGFYTSIDPMDAAAGWSAAMSDGAWGVTGPTLLSTTGAGARVNTTSIAHTQEQPIDGFSASIACIRPTSALGIVPGMIINVDVNGPAVEHVLVSEVHRSGNPGTISGIVYDSGSTGLCTIQLNNTPAEIEENALIKITTHGDEYTRVISVTEDAVGGRSFRCRTANTHQAGDTVQPYESFVCHVQGTLVADPINLTDDGLRYVVTSGGANPTAVLTVDKSVSVDLSAIVVAGLGTAASSANDWIDLGIRFSNQSNILDGMVMFDFDKTTNDFTQNYYYRPFTQSALTPVIDGTQSAIDNRTVQIQRGLTERPPLQRVPFSGAGQFSRNRNTDPAFPNAADVLTRTAPVDAPSASQPGSGNNQWTELRFRVSELQRVGTDATRGLKDIAKVRIKFTLKGGITIDMDNMSLQGGFEPDITDADVNGYFYRYRGRNSTTGAVSNFGPATRMGVRPVRQTVFLTFTAHTSSDVDTLDVERFGGPLEGWHRLTSISNSGNMYFRDNIGDDAIIGDPSDNDGNDQHYRPWLQTDSPKSGAATTIGSSLIQTSGNSFSTAWIPGTLLRVGGRVVTVYRVLSTTHLQINESIGYATGVPWEVSEPTVAGVALPCLWGPYEECLFAVGDPKNPGLLYFTNPNNPDATRGPSFVEVTAPGEPLQNGWVWNGKAYVASTERTFQIIPQKAGNSITFAVQEVSGAPGLFTRWGLAVAKEAVFLLWKDGIYAFSGGEARSLTQETLAPIFPSKDGVAGVDTNGVGAPSMVVGEAANLRLSVTGRFLHFNYRDGSSNRRELKLDLQRGAWHWDVYGFGAVMHYQDEGSGNRDELVWGANATTAKLYAMGGKTDDGTQIDCSIRTPSIDFGDPAMRKLFGDLRIGVDAGGATITPTVGFDAYATTTALTALPTTTGRVVTVRDLASGAGTHGRDIALQLDWSITNTETPAIYFWEPTWVNRPLDTQLRATDFDDGGRSVCKYIRGLYIEADTANVARTITLQGDAGATLQTLTPVQHNGKTTIYYPLTTPAYAYETRLIGVDAALWRLYKYELDFDPAPPLSTQVSEWNNFGEAVFLQGGVLDIDTAGVTVSLQSQVDQGVNAQLVSGITATQRGRIPFNFNPPFITHMIRWVPQANARLWPTTWIFEPEAELGDLWETQNCNDGDGYQRLYRALVEFMPTALGSLTLTVVRVDDNATFAFTIPVVAGDIGVRVKKAVQLSAIKVLDYRLKLSATNKFRLYKTSTEMHLKSWGDQGPFRATRPFGGPHHADGARI